MAKKNSYCLVETPEEVTCVRLNIKAFSGWFPTCSEFGAEVRFFEAFPFDATEMYSYRDRLPRTGEEQREAKMKKATCFVILKPSQIFSL